MTLADLSLYALGGYLVILLLVAEVARRARKGRTPADHFLAGRGLGLLVLFLTIYATTYSGNSLLGFPGEAYEHGFVWIQSTGFMIAIIVMFHLLAPRLRRASTANNFITPGDWVVHRFGGAGRAGRLLRTAVALLMTWALANYLFAQFQAMGELTETITEGVIPHAVGVAVLAAMILVYETLGGMRAVAWTDAAQGILMFVGLGMLLAWLLGEAGGIGALTRDVALVRPRAVVVPDSESLARWVSSTMLLGIASVIYPQAIQRIFAARSDRALARSFALMSMMPLVTTFVVMLIGLAAIPHFKDLGVLEKDGVMPLLLGRWAEAGPLQSALAVGVFIGALAAIMSTADSVLLSLGSVVAVDLFGRSHTDPATTRFGKRIAFVVTVLAVVLAIRPQFDLWRLIELKLELLIQCAPAFLLAMHWRGLDARSTLAGLLAGTGVALVAAFGGEARYYGIHVGVIGLGVNLVVLFLFRGAVLLHRRRTRRRSGA